MSRFFTAGDSSSESSSDEEQLYSDDEEQQQQGQDEESSSEEEEEEEEEEESSSEEEGAGGVSRFLRDAASSDESSDEDTPKVVKSAKSKRLEELESVIKLIDNATKINDWSSISIGSMQTSYGAEATANSAYRIRQVESPSDKGRYLGPQGAEGLCQDRL